MLRTADFAFADELHMDEKYVNEPYIAYDQGAQRFSAGRCAEELHEVARNGALSYVSLGKTHYRDKHVAEDTIQRGALTPDNVELIAKKAMNRVLDPVKDQIQNGSIFFSEEDAQRMILDVMDEHAEEVARWAQTAKERDTLCVGSTMDSPAGLVCNVDQATNMLKVYEADRVDLIFTRTEQTSSGVALVTAYPSLEKGADCSADYPIRDLVRHTDVYKMANPLEKFYLDCRSDPKFRDSGIRLNYKYGDMMNPLDDVLIATVPDKDDPNKCVQLCMKAFKSYVISCERTPEGMKVCKTSKYTLMRDEIAGKSVTRASGVYENHLDLHLDGREAKYEHQQRGIVTGPNGQPQAMVILEEYEEAKRKNVPIRAFQEDYKDTLAILARLHARCMRDPQWRELMHRSKQERLQPAVRTGGLTRAQLAKRMDGERTGDAEEKIHRKLPFSFAEEMSEAEQSGRAIEHVSGMPYG